MTGSRIIDLDEHVNYPAGVHLLSGKDFINAPTDETPDAVLIYVITNDADVFGYSCKKTTYILQRFYVKNGFYLRCYSQSTKTFTSWAFTPHGSLVNMPKELIGDLKW